MRVNPTEYFYWFAESLLAVSRQLLQMDRLLPIIDEGEDEGDGAGKNGDHCARLTKRTNETTMHGVWNSDACTGPVRRDDEDNAGRDDYDKEAFYRVGPIDVADESGKYLSCAVNGAEAVTVDLSVPALTVFAHHCMNSRETWNTDVETGASDGEVEESEDDTPMATCSLKKTQRQQRCAFCTHNLKGHARVTRLRCVGDGSPICSRTCHWAYHAHRVVPQANE